MKIYFDNVDFNSRSGPNQFGLNLAKQLSYMGHTVADPQDTEVQLSFIELTKRVAPTCLRLDGIWFWKDKDYKRLNLGIENSYKIGEAVIVQSEFDKKLVEKYFGLRSNIQVVHNGISFDELEEISTSNCLEDFEDVWCCASQFGNRPHKRLAENIRYFLETANSKTALIVAGDISASINHPRIFYSGNIGWEDLISVYKRCSTFIHLAALDHCPNVVVHAKASGCKIVCASSGGTKELLGPGDIVIDDHFEDWDFEPFVFAEREKLLDFSKNTIVSEVGVGLDIKDTAQKYIDVLERLL